jgi:hypothetical protein
VFAPGSDLRIRAIWCPTPSLSVISEGLLVRAHKYFDPVPDTEEPRDLVMRLPAEFVPGEYTVRLTCFNDHDVAGRERGIVIQLVGEPASTTPIGEVDPILQPTRYCSSPDACVELQPYPAGFPVGGG